MYKYSICTNASVRYMIQLELGGCLIYWHTIVYTAAYRLVSMYMYAVSCVDAEQVQCLYYVEVCVCLCICCMHNECIDTYMQMCIVIWMNSILFNILFIRVPQMHLNLNDISLHCVRLSEQLVWNDAAAAFTAELCANSHSLTQSNIDLH